MASFAYWTKRILFYLGRIYTEQLKSGDTYDDCKKCIQVSILNFTHIDDDVCYRRIHLREDDSGKLYSDLLELHILELNKVKNHPEDNRRVVTWMRFFNGECEEDYTMIIDSRDTR